MFLTRLMSSAAFSSSSKRLFKLPPLGTEAKGYTDVRANGIADTFDFNQRPRAFKTIRAKYPASYFLHQEPSLKPPDNFGRVKSGRTNGVMALYAPAQTKSPKQGYSMVGGTWIEHVLYSVTTAVVVILPMRSLSENHRLLSGPAVIMQFTPSLIPAEYLVI